MSFKYTKIHKSRKILKAIILTILLLFPAFVIAKQTIVFRGFSSFISPSVFNDMFNEINYNVYSRLISLRDFSTVIPDLAYKWEISKNGTVYDFYLRKKVYFHDGSVLAPEDVKLSLERALKKSTFSIFYRKILIGMDDFLRGKEKHIKGIECLKDNIIRIKLKRASNTFLRSIASIEFSIVKILDNKKIGTGPYIIKEINAPKGVLIKAVLEKNEKYFLSLNSPDKIIIFDKNKIKYVPDIFSAISLISDPFIKKYRDYRKYKAFDIFLHAILFNFRGYWGKNKNFRNFIGYGFDFRKLAKNTYRYFDLPYNIIPSGVEGFNKIPAFPSHNYKKALEYLKEIKDREREVKLLTLTTLKREVIAKKIKEFLENHGFRVKETLFDVFGWGDIRKAFLGSDIILASFKNADDILDPAFFLYKTLNIEGEDNFLTYKNPYIEDLTRKLLTGKVRNKVKSISFIINILNEDMPIIPYANSYIIYFVDKKISFSSPPLMPFIDYRSVKVNEK